MTATGRFFAVLTVLDVTSSHAMPLMHNDLDDGPADIPVTAVRADGVATDCGAATALRTHTTPGGHRLLLATGTLSAPAWQELASMPDGCASRLIVFDGRSVRVASGIRAGQVAIMGWTPGRIVLDPEFPAPTMPPFAPMGGSITQWLRAYAVADDHPDGWWLPAGWDAGPDPAS